MLTKTDNAAAIGMHVFERAGLGKAPFRCVGMIEKAISYPDGTSQASGCCDFCGNGIRFVFQVKSRDGRVSGVGSNCVDRTGDAGLIKSYKTHPAVRAANRAKAIARDDHVCAEWKSLIETPATIEKLSALFVQGRPWVPGEQVTLLDDVKRRWSMCGAAGRARTLKSLKSYL